ncbi:hypothetical protein Btru_037913 [Bulinus truncatus]|nr:hypothetical protein Btru_037913 [Bulinus truncatus]
MNCQMLCLTVVSAMCMTMVISSPYWYKDQDMEDYVDMVDTEPGQDVLFRDRRQYPIIDIHREIYVPKSASYAAPSTGRRRPSRPTTPPVRAVTA